MEDLETAYRRTVQIGAAMTASLLAYLTVAFFLRAAGGPFEGLAGGLSPETVELLRYVFLTVSVVQAAAARIVPARLSSPPPGASGEPPARKTVIGRLVAAHILAFALAESIGIFGLVFFLLTGSMMDFFVFLGLSGLVFFFSFPRHATWQERVRQHAPRID